MRALGVLASIFLLSPIAVASDQGRRDVAAAAGAWGPLLEWGIQAMHLVVLRGGVLVVSDEFRAAVWDPARPDRPPLEVPFGGDDLHCAGQATLPDGRAIVVGGTAAQAEDHDQKGIAVTALFDPATRAWVRAAPMRSPRWYPTATVLGDGRLFVASGTDAGGAMVRVPEIYDPGTGSWTALPAAEREQELYPFQFLLPDGRIVDAGPGRPTWFLDPARDGAWIPGPRNEARPGGAFYASAVQYAPGRILVAGGGDPANASATVLDLADPAPGWRAVEPMGFPRRRFTLVLLADGSVLAVGGERRGDGAAVLAPERWNPRTGRWTALPGMAESRVYHSTAALLPDGRVVVGGGEAAGRQRAQIYSPPYLFRGPRPRIDRAPEAVAYGTTFDVAIARPADVARVTLLRPAAVTHGFDHNQRLVPLAFRRGARGLAVAAPPDGHAAPPGDYLLVVVDRRGVPSAGRWVRVRGGRPTPSAD